MALKSKGTSSKKMTSVSGPPLVFIIFCVLESLSPQGCWGRMMVPSNSVLPPFGGGNPPLPDLQMQRRLLKMKGREVIPPITSNAIPGEPSCDELRAMWRYYKRQSRAELTNEIPRFGSSNPFLDLIPLSQQQSPRISSFVPVKGRARARLKLKNQKQQQAYGRVLYSKEGKARNKPRPMEEVAGLMGKGPVGGGERQKSPPTEGVIHYSPPPSTTASSFQTLREVLREEKIRDGDLNPTNPPPDGGRTFGRIVLGPPKGSDGRVANKPRELMTPFERIRFGHADDILLNDDRPNMNFNLMAKRRTLPLHQRPVRPPFKRGFRRGGGGDDVVMEGLGWGSFPDADPNFGFPEEEEQDPYQSFQGPLYPQEIGKLEGNPTCLEVEGQDCRENSDCSCVGYGLYRCHVGRCQALFFSPPLQETGRKDETEEDEGDFWHSGPLEETKLGMDKWDENSSGFNNPLPLPSLKNPSESNPNENAPSV